MACESPDDRAAPATLSPPLLVFILVIFLISGSAGLIYEVIWTRVLLTVFGATLYAVSTVLAAFMGGLALGSLVGGRIADRAARPLRLFALAEALAAIFALLVPHMLAMFDPLYHAVYGASGGEASFFGLSLLRFFLSFIVLLVPTTCMGATLPLLSRFLVRRPGAVGGRIGALYAVNTFGAVVGTFLAGFVLISRFGVAGTIFLAAMADISVAVISAILSLRLERNAKAPLAEEADALEARAAREGDEDAEPDVSPAMARLVLVTYGISGFVALAYQVFWTRALVFRFEFLKNTTYSFSAMLTVFLIGLAAGSAVMSGLVGRYRRPLRLYGLIQLLIGLSAAFSLLMLVRFVPFIRIGASLDPETLDFDWLNAVVNVFARTFATIGLPTFLMGMAFPVAARICVRHLRQVGRGTGRLYAANTLGSIVGSFAAGFVLVPLFGITHGLLALGLLNILIGAVVLLSDPARRLDPSRYIAVALALLAVGLAFLQMRGRYAFQEVENALSKIVDYREGPLATVAVVENSIGDRTLYVDNVGVAGTDRILLTDQKSLAHLPMLVLEDPKSALTVGFGSGGASYSYTVYPELERIDCIEICDTVLQAAPYLTASNHGVLEEPRDPRYRLIIDDARSYLRFTDTRYDIIATDCTDLRYKSNANLYDVEYFELCREHLTDDGAVVVWMPLGGMTRQVFLCALKTFHVVFPNMTVWYMNNEPTHYILLLGTRNDKPLRIDLDRFLERAARPAVQRDLEEISLQQPEKILSCYVLASADLQDVYSDIPLNTENTPYLEFESPKYGYSDEPMLLNLELLRKERATPIDAYLADAEEHPQTIARLRRFEKAVDPILDGHANLRRLAIHEACRDYMRAKEVCPEDKSVDFLLTFHDLRRSAARGDNPMALVILGEVLLMQKDHLAAAQDFDAAMRMLGRLPRNDANRAFFQRAVVGLARCYIETGRASAGARFLRDHEKLLRDAGAYEELRQGIEALKEARP